MDDRLTDRPIGLRLRPAVAQDRDFLFSVYASTRTEELSVVPWSEAEKTSFLRMQFDAQDSYYQETYADAQFLVVTHDEVPIGRLYRAQLADEIRIIDIALLPPHRGLGIGSKLISAIAQEASRAGLAVRLHVEPWNPARQLYERFGFRTIQTGPVYELMELAPSDQLKTAS